MPLLASHVEKYAHSKQLFDKDSHILVAVSGGIDSMVLLHILQQLGLKLSVAHCNFNLRGAEADADEAFVVAYCKKHKLPLHNEGFKTADIAKETGESIQMAARRLRYDWFNALLLVHNYTCIATAHNANDVAETFFVNLSRGTGLAGLTGIKPKMGNVARPLLFAPRKDIEAYAKANKVKWRDDSSNQSIKYRRNLIRHKVVPVFEEINPSFSSSILQTIARLEQSNILLKRYIDEALEEVLDDRGADIYIHIKKLQQLQPVGLYLFEMLHPYGFNAEQIDDIELALSRNPGAQFFAPGYVLTRNREYLILQALTERDVADYTIAIGTKKISKPVELVFNVRTLTAKTKLQQPATIALLDFNKLQFPLLLRRPKTGDRFMPFGMKQSKLLSDFFKDSKLAKPDREAAWVLESAGKIAWVIGYRTDNRFRVDDTTKVVLKITLDNK